MASGSGWATAAPARWSALHCEQWRALLVAHTYRKRCAMHNRCHAYRWHMGAWFSGA